MDLSTALNIASTTAVAGGVIFGAWQIREATRSRTTQIALRLLEMLNAEHLADAFTMLGELPEGLGWEEMRLRLGDRWSVALTVISSLDGLGVMVYRGEVPLRVADDYFHHVVMEVWKKARAAILEHRKDKGFERAFQFLEWLAVKQQAYRDGAGRKPGLFPLELIAEAGIPERANP